jgi:hypothetical protein
MKTLFYKKQGRRYVPVSEYDNELIDALPKGDHLVSVYPGGSSRRYKIDPALAPMIAAGRYAEDAVCRAIAKAAELRPPRTPITEKQKKAWNALAEAFGDELCTLQGLSIRDCAEAGVTTMQAEADKLMKNDSVRKAYEHFMLMCKLTKEKENADT